MFTPEFKPAIEAVKSLAPQQNESGHTPAPWHIETAPSGQTCIMSDTAWICGQISNGNGEDERETTANANLLTASPDLLSSATEALHYLVEYATVLEGHDDERAARIRLALADAIVKAAAGAP